MYPQISANDPHLSSTANSYLINNAILIDAESTTVDASLLVEDGKITAIASRDELLQKAQSDCVEIDAKGYICAPAWNDSHCHTAMTFLRDLAHNAENVIENLFFPMESNLRRDLVGPLAYPYILQGLQSGTACFWEHYYFADAIAEALDKFGVRGMVGETIADQGGAFPSTTIWPEWRKQIENWNFSNRVQPVVAPHAGDTVSESLLKELASYAKQENLLLHFHLSQSKFEMEKVKKATGKTPVEYARDCGALFERSLAVHLVTATDSDLKILKDSGTHIGFCPKSQILYEELAPIDKFLEHDIPVCLGTDAAASNDMADMLEEMRFAAFMIQDRGRTSPKILTEDSTPEAIAIAMATKTPGKLRNQQPVGLLKAGHAADLVLIGNPLSVWPITKPVTNLLFTNSSRNVAHTMVDGDWVLWNQTPTKINISDLEAEFKQAIQEIRKLAGLPQPIV